MYQTTEKHSMCKGSVYAVKQEDADVGVSYCLHNGGDRQHRIAVLKREDATFNSRGQIDVAYCIREPADILITGMNESFRRQHKLPESFTAHFIPAGENYWDEDMLLLPDNREMKLNSFLGNTELRIELAPATVATLQPESTASREHELVTA